MNGWNEQTLRSAASWKAFKEGKALFDSGAVTDVKSGATGWRGTVSTGKRPIRVSVTVKSATDLETRCPCPENQSNGEFCAHAVATGLATLAGGIGVNPEPAPQPATALAYDFLLPPQWREALSRGKFTATVCGSSRSSLDPADRRLAAWFASERSAPAPGIHLHLDGPRVSTFLDALAGHPGVFTSKERVPITISTGHRFKLAEARQQGDEICLLPAQDDGPWHEMSGSFWQFGEDFLKRAGSTPIPAAMAATLKPLARGESARIYTSQLLSNLDAWQDWLSIPPDSWLESLHFIPAAASFHLSLDGSLQQLRARLSVSYRNSAPVVPGLGTVENLPELNGDRCEIRDHATEKQAVRHLESAGFQSTDPGSWTLRGETPILRFLTATLPALRQSWTISESQRFSQAGQQIAIVTPQIEILGSGEDWLGFDLKFQTADGIEIPRQEIQRLLSSGKASGTMPGGRRAVLTDDLANLIEPLFSELDLQQTSGHYETSARTGELILEIQKKLSKSLKNDGQENLFTFQKPSSLRANLRHYQEQGSAWLEDRTSRFGGALLADDMGLGKTLQAIALIENLFIRPSNDCGVVLVVATASLLGNWQAEFGRFAPGRQVRILHGGGRDQEREKLQPGEVAITSYGTLARDLAWHLRQDYRAVVVDEASLMRNPDTDHAKAAAKLRARHRIALTGTPVENSVRDLWSVFRFIQPGWLGTREDFRERYEMPLAAGEGAAAVMERLKLRISPFILRRTKEQVAPELPSKLIIDEFCDLSPDQQAVYRDLLAEGRRQVETLADAKNAGAARMRMLTTLLRLRQSCCDLGLLGNERLQQLPVPRRSAKLERLLELLEEAVNGNHRVLVFSQFQKQLVEIQHKVSEKGWDCLRLDGQTRNRQEMVEKFQAPDGPPVFLISLKAGGYGLNLTAADTVIHFDPWWNPAAEAQATDRAHRIGQTRPVTVYRLLTRGTVEEQVVRLQARKRELATAIDESGESAASGWSIKDLQAVITQG